MTIRDQFFPRQWWKAPFTYLLILLAFLWLAGGGSRADIFSQFIVRSVAWGILIAGAIFLERPNLGRVQPVAAFVVAAIALVGLQLIPLPPAIWTSLPGREVLERAATVIGEDQPWRPLSISPGATMNALNSLVVPLVTLLLVSNLTRGEYGAILSTLLALITLSALIGLYQFSGGRIDFPFINDVRGMVSANFANRNHFALFAAIGCVLAITWALQDHRRGRLRIVVAFGLVVILLLLILATGSRMGIVLGVLALILGAISNAQAIMSQVSSYSKKIVWLIFGGAIVLLTGALALSVELNRASSLTRVLSLDVEDDLRHKAFPTVLRMTFEYFPFGAGFGTFDHSYRIHESSALLRYEYFNHAHNDWLEVILDGGLLSLILLGASILWWAWRSWKVWFPLSRSSPLSRAGSAILLLVFVASATDYPARTPMIMALIVISAVWLAAPWKGAKSSNVSKPLSSSSDRPRADGSVT